MAFPESLIACTLLATRESASQRLKTELAECLRKEGFTVYDQVGAIHANEGKDGGPAIVVLNEMDEETCGLIQQASRRGAARLLAVTERGSQFHATAWKALEMGASDVLVWEETLDPLGVIRARMRRWVEVDHLIESPIVRETIVGESPAWKSVLRQVVEAARFTSSPVLLTGETGTGKELIARLIHRLDTQRSQYDQVVVDCTTIVPDLSGSELFGHERGAFTGAINPRDGAFALADQGTLFLDEVGELPANLQVQLLRVLQEHTFKRVGSNNWQKTDFRLVCATNRELHAGEGQSSFRRDLYYRIASWKFHLPPLRERQEDILLMVRHFMTQALRPGDLLPDLDDRVQAYFLERDYPGNVRDLRNLVFRITARHVGPGPVSIGDIPADERPGQHKPSGGCVEGSLDYAVRHVLRNGYDLRKLALLVRDTAMRVTVDDERGNLQRAASRLGVSDRLLQKWKGDQQGI